MLLIALSIAGLLLSFGVLGLLKPRIPVPWRWTWQGVVLHASLWFAGHTLLVALLGRPWFALAIGLALVMLIVQVSNAKFVALREPFVFQDFEYFTDAIQHPRLYIPFLGWWKFALIALVVVVALFIGMYLEGVASDRFSLAGQGGALLGLGAVALLLFSMARAGRPLSFDPQQDMARLGLLGCLWCYARAEREALVLPDRFGEPPVFETWPPDLVVVQSESFFDPRPLFSGIRPEVLAAFDQIRNESLHHGRLSVPAWGANTVRSEFAFLAGVGEAELGVHRFNPYRRILSAQVGTLPRTLRAAGYRTVCVHPYPASFYNRVQVHPHLGFDAFIDIREFAGAERFGPYVADAAVTRKVQELLGAAGQPLFVFVITMENHGPLHLEHPTPGDAERCYSILPPVGCDDLTAYLLHLGNADRMIRDLKKILKGHLRPARLCWYGDHVPIMAAVYAQLGEPDGRTEFFFWSNEPGGPRLSADLSLGTLALTVLNGLGRGT